MISHKHKCIFIHIPKCAGTSIESALGHLDGHVGRGGQDHRTIRMLEKPMFTYNTFSNKSNFMELRRRFKNKFIFNHLNPNNKLSVSRSQYDSYFKFSIIRNPWSRAFSYYQRVLSDEINRKKAGVSHEITLNDFLERFVGKGLLRPQIFWLKNSKGEIPLDYVGRFENLEADVQSIFNNIDFENKILPHKIRGSNLDYREHYDDDSKSIISEVCKEEISLFNYKFEK